MILVDIYETFHKGIVVDTDDPDKACDVVEKAIREGKINTPALTCEIAGFRPLDEVKVDAYGKWDNTGKNPYPEIKP